MSELLLIGFVSLVCVQNGRVQSINQLLFPYSDCVYFNL